MLVTGNYHEESHSSGEDLSPSVIVVMGATGSGKTSFVNLASKSKLSVGTNLRSCTEEVQASKPFTLDGRPVVLVDTPGFHDTFKSDMDILDSIAQSMAEWYERGESIGGIIYLHRISDVRFTGTAGKSFKTLLAMCGDDALRNLVIVTNMWGKVTPEVGTVREQELAESFFKPALDKGARLLRHDHTPESTHDVIRTVLENQRVTLQIQEEMVDRWKQVGETAAGKELQRELNRQAEKRLIQLREIQEMLNQTEASDGETRQELRQEILTLREELGILNRMSNKPGMSGFRANMQDLLFFTVLGAGWFLWRSIQ